MKTISIKINAINVLNLSARDATVEFEVLFNDYKTIKNISIEDPNEIAHDLIIEIRRKIKEKHQTEEGEHILDNIVNVIIEDEEATIQKISMFLAKLADKINSIKNATIADNYMNMINNIKSTKLELNKNK